MISGAIHLGGAVLAPIDQITGGWRLMLAVWGRTSTSYHTYLNTMRRHSKRLNSLRREGAYRVSSVFSQNRPSAGDGSQYTPTGQSRSTCNQGNGLCIGGLDAGKSAFGEAPW